MRGMGYEGTVVSEVITDIASCVIIASAFAPLIKKI